MRIRMIAFTGSRAKKMMARELYDEYNKHGPYKVSESLCSVTPAMGGGETLWIGLAGRWRGWKAWKVRRYLRNSHVLKFVSEGTLYDINAVQWGLQ